MIGNRNYVKKHYGTVVEQALAHYEELVELFRKIHPRSTNARDGSVHLGLEIHHSQHTWAWHGIIISRKNPYDPACKELEWRPASFYGYACLVPSEYMPVLQGKKEEA